MRELNVSETEIVSGGTSIYDVRSGTPGSGLPNDPLNTGNPAIDLANAFALMANGEVSPGALFAIRPDIATAIAGAVASELADMFPGSDEEGFLECLGDGMGGAIIGGMAAGAVYAGTAGAVMGSVAGGIGAVPGAALGATTGAITGAFTGAGGQTIACALGL